MAALKLISLNIEGHRHLHERVIPFLQAEQPDVVQLQEVFAADVPVLAEALEMEAFFAAMTDVQFETIHLRHALGVLGNCQLTRLPVLNADEAYYFSVHPDYRQIPLFFERENPNSINRVVQWLDVRVGQTELRVATTHFTWSPEGKFTADQQRDFAELEKCLDRLGELVLTGDFNSPRQSGVDNAFSRLSQRYTDHIPATATTSLDGQFHKAGQLQLMVDGFFSSPSYRVLNVRLVNGVSDHYAVCGVVERV